MDRPPGILVPDSPEQKNLPPETRPLILAGEVLQPLANYRLRARLIRQEPYYFDRGAKLAPIDLCVGWGPLSDSSILDAFDFSQVNRFCMFRWSGQPPIDQKTFGTHMANIHAIPADEVVRSTLKRLRPGQILTLTGKLVRVDGKDGFSWTSSLSREDEGAGACELMYITSVLVHD